ncbi:MAG: hypothetical protein JKY19_05060 [Alcanivoracaceae bacterium]|nr:hypothetical protein [Alcanivoracaceae bacterium]
MNTIYKRTAKGEDEIKKRTFKLDHALRFVLIMVDGKTCADDIISQSSEQWKPVQCLFELENQGFIENIDSNAPPSANIGQLKQNLISVIQQYLPKNNTELVNKILNAELKKKSMADAIDSNCIFIKLTISEEISNQLKIKLHNILNNSSEI